MVESEIHRFIKEKITEALREEGYSANMEVLTSKGIVDVVAEKDGQKIKVEVIKTHAPEWLFVKVKGNMPSKKKRMKPDEYKWGIPQTYIDILSVLPCTNCGKMLPKERIEKFNGLCMDCFDEVFIKQFGSEYFRETLYKFNEDKEVA